MRNRFLARAIAALAIFAAALLPASPAQASWSSERPREGASTWVPRYVDFQSWRDTAPLVDVGVLQFGFQWHQNQHLMELEGGDQTFEINAEIPCSWVEFDSGDFTTTEGYVPEYWSTNIPASAHPYEDTILIDNCTDGKITWGFGVLDVHLLSPGTYYWVTVGMKAAAYSDWTQSNITLKVQTGITYDADIPWYDDGDCSWNAGEMDDWNDPNVAGIQLRHQAGYCSWPEWTHVVARSESGALKTGQYKYFWTNKLTNQGFEAAGNPGSGYWMHLPGGGSSTRYCNDIAGAFDGACFLQFNGPGHSALVQDLPTPTETGNHATAEAAIRCRSASPCSIGLRVWTYDSDPNEWAKSDFTLPANSGWYLCRLDYDHVTSGEPNVIFDLGSSLWQYAVWNYTGTNIDVDYSFVGGKTFYSAPDGNPHGHIPGDRDGAGCSVVSN